MFLHKGCWLGAILITQALTAAPPAEPGYTLEAEPGVTTRVYRVGETITFKLDRKVSGGATSTIRYRVEENNLNILAEGALPPDAGDREVLAVPRNPGFLILRAWETGPGQPAGEETDPYKLASDVPQLVAGAAIAPDALLASGEVPADFDEFWQGKLAALKNTPLETLEMVPVESGNPEVLAWDIKIAAPGAKPVSGYLARPAKVKPHACPGLVMYQGAGVRSADLDAAVRGAEWGALTLYVNCHGILNGQPDDYYAQLLAGEYDNYARKHGKNRDEIYFGDMYVRALRALEYIRQHPAWDGKVLITAGQSQGAAQAIAAAALDPKVTGVFAGIPALADLTALDAGRRPGWPFNGYTADKPPPAAFAYFDTVNFATRVRVPGLFAIGLQDRIAPPASGYRAYLAYEGPKEALLMGDVGHALDRGAEKAFKDFVKARSNPVPPEIGKPAAPPKVSFTAPEAP
jgi:cephalosporin-C deacetylase